MYARARNVGIWNKDKYMSLARLAYVFIFENGPFSIGSAWTQKRLTLKKNKGFQFNTVGINSRALLFNEIHIIVRYFNKIKK